MGTLLASRRQFLLGIGATTLSTCLSNRANEFLSATTGLDFLKNKSSAIRFGYAAITWQGNDDIAIKEISELGFPGIQLRSNVLEEYGDRPDSLKSLLAQNKLEMVALSSGGVGIAPGTEGDEIAKHLKNARFVADVGGRYLQLTDSARPKGRKPEAADFLQLGRVMTEIAKRSNDLGVPVGYHNHMGSLGESPDELDQIMKASDPRHVKLELDIAHYQQGGGDPVKALRQYRDRLLFLHIKDVEPLTSLDPRGRAYRFVELGRGRVDLPAVFKTLEEIKFRGWAVIELDAVPDKARTPRECAEINKRYIQEKLQMKISN